MTTIDATDIGIACGGSRSGICTWLLPGEHEGLSGEMYGSAYGEAFADTPDLIQALWFSTYLFGDVPTLGPCLMRYNEARTSGVDIVSNQPGGDPFYPASATHELWYRLEQLDELGLPTRALFNLEPMVMKADIEAIPPIGVDFDILSDVTFFDISTTPATPVIILRAHSTGAVGDSHGIELDKDEDVDVGSGTFRIGYTATNLQPDRAQTVHWASTTVGASSFASQSTSGVAVFGSRNSFEISGTFDPADLSARVIVHAVATGEARGEAHAVTHLTQGTP